MKSQEHHYSEIAYRAVSQQLKPSHYEAFERVCHSFPSYVQINGLRLAVAYFEKKAGEQEYKDYLVFMGEALLGKPLSKSVIPGEFTAYRRLTMEALRAAAWFKRYAEARQIQAKADASKTEEENGHEPSTQADQG